MAAIRVRDLHFAYDPGVPVLQGLDLEVAPGRVCGLLGPNGAGKTTLFRLLVGLETPDAGTVELSGLSPYADPADVRERSGYMPEESLLYRTLSVAENLNLFALLWGVEEGPARERSEALLRSLALWEVRGRAVEELSRGMRRKLELAAALLHRPEVLLLDEPFSGLDLEAVSWARSLLREMVAAGGGVLFASHAPGRIAAFADEVGILKGGKIVYRADVPDDGDGRRIAAVFRDLFPEAASGDAAEDDTPADRDRAVP